MYITTIKQLINHQYIQTIDIALTNQLNHLGMKEYIVGYYTPYGRKTITIVASSREAARTEAYSMGYQVIDVSID